MFVWEYFRNGCWSVELVGQGSGGVCSSGAGTTPNVNRTAIKPLPFPLAKGKWQITVFFHTLWFHAIALGESLLSYHGAQVYGNRADKNIRPFTSPRWRQKGETK
jgi:hypothetical protein